MKRSDLKTGVIYTLGSPQHPSRNGRAILFDPQADYTLREADGSARSNYGTRQPVRKRRAVRYSGHPPMEPVLALRAHTYGGWQETEAQALAYTLEDALKGKETPENWFLDTVAARQVQLTLADNEAREVAEEARVQEARRIREEKEAREQDERSALITMLSGVGITAYDGDGINRFNELGRQHQKAGHVPVEHDRYGVVRAGLTVEDIRTIVMTLS